MYQHSMYPALNVKPCGEVYDREFSNCCRPMGPQAPINDSNIDPELLALDTEACYSAGHNIQETVMARGAESEQSV
jgi:hypothetical protein